MKKLAIVAVAFAAVVFASCGGNKEQKNNESNDSIVKTFEQEQIEENIKLQLDSLAAGIGKLKQLPIVEKDGIITLTEQEKQVKPDFLLDPAIAENATTLSEKYRAIAALQVDKQIALLYEMPVDEYDKAITKLAADISDPAFKALEDEGDIFEASETLYNGMKANGRINYFWQIVASSLIEQLYITTQNSEKFLASFNDEAAENITFRIILLQDAIERLTVYDPEIEPIAKAIEPLETLNAISVSQLKEQLEQVKEDLAVSRNNLLK